SLYFRYNPLLFGAVSLLFGVPTEPQCEHCQNAYNNEHDISDPRHRRPFVLRLFGLMQRFLSRGLSGSDRLKLLALLAQSRLSLPFARADEVELQGRGLGRTLRPTRHPSLGRGYIVS